MLRVTEAIQLAGLSDTTWLTPEAAARGTAVHAAVALDVAGQLDEGSVHPVVAPYLASWRQFRLEASVCVSDSELEVQHLALGYAGRLDMIAAIGSSLQMVIDLKTGAPASWHPIQTAGYALARQAMNGGSTPPRGAVYLQDDGSAARFVAHKDRHDFDVFRAAVVIAHFKKQKGIQCKT